MLALLVACTAPAPDSGAADSAAHEITDYVVHRTTDPDPIEAGEEATFTLQITDQDGNPIDDLQRTHERMVHTIFISRDLADFQHVHHEDFADITADDLQAATFHFPVTFPTAGDELILYDFAHRDQWLYKNEIMVVDGAPMQATSPVVDLTESVDNADIHVDFSWTVAPVANFEAVLSVHITDTTGADVVDLVPWLGADGHAAVVCADLTLPGHTHAWFPDMEGVTPSHTMPHLYTGPDVPFHYTFAKAGVWKMWVQFARAGAPDAPYAVPFMFEVAP